MSTLETQASAPADTPVLAGAVQELLTSGYCMLDRCVSDRLLGKIARSSSLRLDGRFIRQIYDGLPARIIEQVIGSAVLSRVDSAISPQWHRGRSDFSASGAPTAFVPGIDVVAALENSPLGIELLCGSGRLRDAEAIPFSFSGRVEINPTQLLLLDTRLFRRRVAGAGTCLVLKIVRSWILPEEVFPEVDDPATPPRAAAFFGRDTAPSRDLAEWLQRTHPKRS
jgi:hypothetical protein